MLPHLPILNKEAGSKQNHVILPVTVERLYYGDLQLDGDVQSAMTIGNPITDTRVGVWITKLNF